VLQPTHAPTNIYLLEENGMGGSTGDLLGTGSTGGRSFAQPMSGGEYNRRLQAGETDQNIRASQSGFFGGGPSANQWNDIVTQAGMQSPTGRPLAGSAQFYQPVQQQQYQNYQTGNPMNVSQYGRQQAGGGFNQQPSMFGGQMQGGGYGQFGMNNPFSPYSNSFLNLDPNLNRGTQADKADAYRNAIQSGFGDQQVRNQATALFGPQSSQDWGYLQGSAMGLTPGLAQESEQDKIRFYQDARSQGFNDQTVRNAANQMIGNQSQGDWGYLQNQAGFGGGSMPQYPQPFQQPQTAPAAPRVSSGPAQAIVSRSAGMRGAPNVMRRAEGGIASLLSTK
jgi:hypothetical protein